MELDGIPPDSGTTGTESVSAITDRNRFIIRCGIDNTSCDSGIRWNCAELDAIPELLELDPFPELNGIGRNCAESVVMGRRDSGIRWNLWERFQNPMGFKSELIPDSVIIDSGGGTSFAMFNIAD